MLSTPFAMPLFFIFRRMGVVDNLLGHIIAYTAFNLPFNIWRLESFFRDIPRELADAVTVDGGTPLSGLSRVRSRAPRFCRGSWWRNL